MGGKNQKNKSQDDRFENVAQTTYNIICCTYDFLQKPFNDLFGFVFVLYFSFFSKLLLSVEK